MAEAQAFVSVRDGGVTTAAGIRAGATSAGVREGSSRLDLAVVVADEACVASGVFTRSRIVAAPVVVSRERLQRGRAQGVILNSGNANACTGGEGLAAARAMADEAARHLQIDSALMLVASTGLIGVSFPSERVRRAIPALRPTREGGHDAARAIMTTDRVPKEVAVAAEIDGRQVAVGGMAKGAGMIHPNLATLLAVLTTDARLDPAFADTALRRAVDGSFNQVSVDGDTSTNDTVVLLATGAAGGPPLRAGTRQGAVFQGLLEEAGVQLARMIARDGEGATRLIEVTVEGARSPLGARRLARAVASSNLVKAAVYGCDPNWGRILMAMGNAQVDIDPDSIDVSIGGHVVARDGAPCPFDSAAVAAAMGADQVEIRLCLHQGGASGRAWGCDLTEEYVRINAEYTT